MHIRSRRKLFPGGFKDNLAMSAMSMSGFMSHPFLGLNGALGGATGLGLAGMGGAWAAKRFLDVGYRSVFSSGLQINSDESVYDGNDGITLGYAVDSGKPVKLGWDDWVRHCFIVGQSGVGKTVFGEWIMFQQIIKGGGLLWIDGKLDPDNITKLDAMCTWAGRKSDLYVINPGDPSMSNSYNPILFGDADEISSRIISLIPSSEGNAGTDFYRQAANQGVTTLVAAIQRAGKCYNFMDLAILLQSQKTLDYLESIVPNGTTEKKALQLFLDQYRVKNKDGVSMIDMKRLKETFGGIGGRMHLFGSGNFGAVTNTYTPDVNMYEAVRDGKIVYVALPTMGKQEAASNFGKMVVGDFRSAIAKIQELPKHERPNPPFLNFSDEAGSYVTPAWRPVFEQSRSAKIAVMPAVQTIANLDAVSPELREAIIGNTWTKVFFKVGTDETAKKIVELIGNEKRVAITTSLSGGRGVQQDSTGSTRKGSSGSDSFGLSEREEEVEKVTADMLKKLGKGEAIITIEGSKVYHIKIPALIFNKKFMKKLDKFTLNKKRPAFANGLDLFRDINQWLS